MSADFEQVMAQCSRGCFTGLLRVRTRQGNGEIRFLSGIQDGIRFDAVEGDAALERLLAASDPEFEAISSLPPIDFNATEPVPVEGSLTRFHAAQLMRYCESNSLTCALELEVEGTVLTARYRLGELLSVEPDSEHTARLAEAKVGLYRFRLPRFELPANVQQRRSPPPPAKAVPSKPAPVRSPAPSQAETPLMGVRSVAVSPPSASPASPAVAARAPSPSVPAPARAPSPSVPSPSALAPSRAAATIPAKVAAAVVPPSSGARATDARSGPGPARSITIAGVPSPANTPAAAARRNDARSGGTLIGASPPVLKPQEPRQAPPASQSAPTPAMPPVAPAAAASAGPVTPPSTRPRSPLPPQPTSTSPQPSAPLQGLWAEAVKPPPQSAPLELDSASPASPAKAAPGSTPKAVARDAVTAVASRGADEAVKSSQRQRGAAKYWLLAIALMVVLAMVAGYFLFGR
jgi:hypothetical protein